MPVTRDMLVTELQNLLRLTAFEQTIATIRRTQARTPELEKELAENVGKARERSKLLMQAIREAGGVPDVVGSAFGKVGAFTTAQLNQVQTLQGALLGDLSLEHQLRERTRYARTLAESLGETSLLPLFDRLETAHTATIEWLEARLAEVAKTGTSLLRATPVQAAVTSVRSLTAVPFGAVAQGVNRVSALATRLGRKAPQPLQEALASAVKAGDAAVDKGVHAARLATQRTEDAAVAAGTGVEAAAAEVAERVSGAASTAAGTARDTAEDAADKVVDLTQNAAETVSGAAGTAADTVQDAAETAADKTADVLESTGGTDVDEGHPPFAGYEKLTGDSIMRHVNDTEDVAELRSLLAFEQAHKARKGVLQAAQERLQALSTNA